MSDLTERLRVVTGFIRFETGDRVAAASCVSEEAADEIERLRAELAAAQAEIARVTCERDQAVARENGLLDANKINRETLNRLLSKHAAEIARLNTAQGAAGVLLGNPEAVRLLCTSYDDADAAQCGEPNPHTVEPPDLTWTEERLDCARAALRAIAGDE